MLKLDVTTFMYPWLVRGHTGLRLFVGFWDWKRSSVHLLWILCGMSGVGDLEKGRDMARLELFPFAVAYSMAPGLPAGWMGCKKMSKDVHFSEYPVNE